MVRIRLGGIVAGTVIFVSAYLLLAILAAPSGFRRLHFEGERGGVTLLSAFLLAVACVLSFLVNKKLQKTSDRHEVFWFQFSWAAGFLFLDELLEFHEKLGEGIARVFGEAHGFRNWNDLIVVGYGPVALIFFIRNAPTIIRYPRFWQLLVTAFIFYGIHTLIDCTQEPATTITIIFEESSKAFCSAFLMLSVWSVIRTCYQPDG